MRRNVLATEDEELVDLVDVAVDLVVEDEEDQQLLHLGSRDVQLLHQGATDTEVRSTQNQEIWQS